MKTVAKVFIIIGMVLEFWLILPLIFGIVTINKMKTTTCKADMTTWGILSLLFVNLICGILILLVSDDEWAQK